MPTSGTRGVWSCGGGQSAVGSSRLPLHQPAVPWARAPASGFGSGVSGQKGRNRTAGCGTGRRRIVKSGVVRGRTGDIAHLERVQYFAFCSPCQQLSPFIRRSGSTHFPAHFPLRIPPALCSNLVGVNSGRASVSRQRFLGTFASHLLGNNKGSRATSTHCHRLPRIHRRLYCRIRPNSSAKAFRTVSAEHSGRFACRACSCIEALSHLDYRARQ